MALDVLVRPAPPLDDPLLDTPLLDTPSIDTGRVGSRPARGMRQRWLERRRERAAARRREWELARLRDLDTARVALAQAAEIIRSGWVQNAWFQVLDDTGRPVGLGPSDLRMIDMREVTGACLVGAVIEATGGWRQARSAATGRTADLLWDTLEHGTDCSGPSAFDRPGAPASRMVRVRELTSWNDQPGRTRDDVLALLETADSRAILAAAAPARS